MNPKSAIAKGKELENWVVNRLVVSKLDSRAARNPGSGNGTRKGDIWNDLGLTIECKNTKKFPHDALLQAERDSLGYQKPVVVWHPPKKPLEDSVVLIGWDYFEELLKKSKEPAMSQPDRDFKYKLGRLRSAAQEVIKEL